MARARGQAEWSRTASVMWVLAEINRDPKRRRQPWTPDDFNPYSEAPRRKPAAVSVERLTDEIMRIAERRSKGR